jgi:type I restriction enzyme R subunit
VYYKGATLVDTTDPNLIHDLQNKLDMADIYTEADVIAVSDVIVENLGHTQLEAAISVPAERFLDRWKTAVDNDDKAELNTLEMFRKDVASFVRLYDFLSQIINYADTDLERRLILLKRLSPRIRTDAGVDPFDTSSVKLDKVKYTKREQAEMKLDVGDPLRPISGVGTGHAKTDPKMVALAEVIEMLNELFGGDMFAQHQQQSWIESVMRALLSDPSLVQQAKANTPQQFMESEDFKNAVKFTIMQNQQTFAKMSEIAATNVGFQDELTAKLAKAFYVWATTPDEPLDEDQN